MYEHVGTKVASSQNGKVYKMAKKYYAWLMISSGESDADLVDNAKTSYIERCGKKIQYDHVWNILKNYSKWNAAEPLDEDNLQELFGPDPRERKCDAAERAYEAKREKEVAMMQCRELEFLMLSTSTGTRFARLSLDISSCLSGSTAKSSIVVVFSENSSCCSSHLMSVPGHMSVATDLIFLSWKLYLCFCRASVEDARPSGSHFFDSLSNCSLKILLGSSKTCIFPSTLFTGSLPLMEKLSSLLAKLDIESSRSAG
nr:ABC transporter Tap-like, P-loop containing nucleoside triphosphate hydrolase [Tanacetum cinerariifolium]